jgi:hypothetical protein
VDDGMHKLHPYLLEAIQKDRPTVIGETAYAETFIYHRRANQLLRDSAGGRLIIAAGGPPLTTHLERALLALDADVGFSGAAEETFPGFLKNLGGRTRLRNVGPGVLDGIGQSQSILVVPDRGAWRYANRVGVPAKPRQSLLRNYDLDALKLSLIPDMIFPSHVGTLQLVFDRGCDKHCAFCLEPEVAGSQVAGPDEILSFMCCLAGFVQAGGFGTRRVEIDLLDSDFLRSRERNRQLDAMIRDESELFERIKGVLHIDFAYISMPSFNADRRFNIDFMKRLGIRDVNIGVDGADRETYRRLRKGGKFGQVDDTIDCLVQAGFVVHMGVILSHQNSTDAQIVEGGQHLLRLADMYGGDNPRLKIGINWAVDPYFGTRIARETEVVPENVGATDDFPGFPIYPSELPLHDAAAARRVLRFDAAQKQAYKTLFPQYDFLANQVELPMPYVVDALKEMLLDD